MNSKKLVGNIFPLVILLAVGCSIASLRGLTQGGFISQVGGASPRLATTWASSDPIGDEWPMEGGQLNRTRATTTTPVSNTTNNGLVWKMRGGETVAIGTSPIISGSHVYHSGFVGTDCYVFRISAATGAFEWQSVIFDNDYFTSPTIAGGSIFVGVQGATTGNHGWVHCINAATGATNWSVAIYNNTQYAPVVSNGRVFVSTTGYNGLGYDGNLTCLDATTGSTVWSIKTVNSQFTVPAIVGNAIFIGQGNNMSCYSALDGTLMWNSTVGATVTSAAVVAGDVYFSAGSTAYCVDFSDGGVHWSHVCGSGTLTAPAANSNFVYVGSSDSKVYALGTVSGNSVWNYTSNEQINVPPDIANGFVYVKNTGDYSKICYLNALTGALNWSYDCHLSSGWGADPSPSIANGYLFQALGGYIYCLPMIFTQPPGTPPPPGILGYPVWTVIAMGFLAVGVAIRKRKIGK